MTQPGTTPKITELRIEALHDDGSRTYLTFIPEPDGHLRVEIEQRVGDVPVETLPRGVVRQSQRSAEHEIRVRDVGLFHVEHLVRASPRH